MKVKIKKMHPDAVIPKYAHDTDAGMDLVATSMKVDAYGCIVYGTGLAFEIPEGYVGLIFPRSSNAKYDLILTNHIGVVDSGYRGEVMLKFKPHGAWKCNDEIVYKNEYEVGDRVGQLIIMPYPKIEFEEVEELAVSDRGAGGYGSTGK